MTTAEVGGLSRLLTIRAGAGGQGALFLALLVLLAVLIAYPLVQVFAVAVVAADGLTLRHFTTFFAHSLLVEALGNTLVAGVAAVAFGTVVALPLAVLIARYDFAGRRLVEALAVLPLVIPPFVGAVAFQQILGRNGMVNLFLLDMFGTMVPFMDGLGGVVLVQTLHYFPFIIVNMVSALGAIDPTAEEAAQSLGAHGWRLFRRITLPLARPGYVAGALLTFIRVIDDLGTPLMLNYPMLLAPQAYLRVTTVGMNDVDVAVICVILVVLSLGALWAAKASLGRREWPSLPRRSLRPRQPLRGGRAALAWLIAGSLLGVALIPQVGIVLLSFSKVWSLSYVPTRFTLDNYGEIFVRAPHVLANTLRYAVLAAGLDVLLGAAIAWLLLRSSVRAPGMLGTLATVPLAVPGIVLAVGYLRAFHGWAIPGLGSPLTATWLILVIVYVVRQLPYTVRAAYATLHQLDGAMEESAQSLGAPPRRTFWQITLPLMTRGLVAGGLIAFISSAVELSATIVLVPRVELGPLSYGIYLSMQSAAGRGSGAALGVVAVVLVAVGTWAVNRVTRRGAGSAFQL